MRSHRWATFPISVIILAVPLLIGAVRLVQALPRTFTSGGDVAFIELGVRQVLHGGIALGPYSRYGWHHPGPSVYYAFAPLYWLSGDSSRSLFLDTWLLNAACLLAVVLVVRRAAGEGTARIAALVLAVFVAAEGFASLINPWNPSLLAVPLLLVIVASAAAASGSGWSFVVALVAGSLVVQTHISTIPVTGVSLVVGLIGLVQHHRSRARTQAGGDGARVNPAPPGHRRSGSWRRAGIAAAVVLLGAMWAGPVIQEVTHMGTAGGGNLSVLLQFYRHPPKADGPLSHSLQASLGAVSDYSTIVPLGSPADVLGHRGRLLTAGALTLVSLAVVVVGWRRHRFLAMLGLLGVLGIGVAVVAASRIIGPYYGYLFLWTECLLLPGLIGAGGLLAGAVARRAASVPGVAVAGGVVVTVALLVTAAVASRVAIDAQTISYQDSPDARAVAARIETLVGHHRSSSFTIDVVQGIFADGPTILTLVKDGYHFRVQPPVDLYDGTTGAGRPGQGPTFELESSGPPPPPLPGRLELVSGSLAMWEVPG